MSNLTYEMKKLVQTNTLEEKELEKSKRHMVMLKNSFDMDTKSLVSGKNKYYATPLKNRAKPTSKDTNNFPGKNNNYVDSISSKQLIDLAFSAFGMNFHGTASKFLKEAIIILGNVSLILCNHMLVFLYSYFIKTFS